MASFWGDFWALWGCQGALGSVQRGPQGGEKMYFKMTKEKRGKYTMFENQRFYYSKTYGFGRVVPQNEVANANEPTTRDVRKNKLVEGKQGRNQNDPRGAKMDPKG